MDGIARSWLLRIEELERLLGRRTRELQHEREQRDAAQTKLHRQQEHQALPSSHKLKVHSEIPVSKLHTLLSSAGEFVPAAYRTVSSGSEPAVQQLQAADRAGHRHK